MIIVPIEQRTPEWFEWRRKGITSTVAPIVMGVGDMTPLQFYEQRLSGEEKKHSTAAMQAGIAIEPRVKIYLEQLEGEEFWPCCVENDIDPWLRTSLDGLGQKTQRWAEYKLFTKTETFEEIVKNNTPPIAHHWQCMHHQLTTGMGGLYVAVNAGNVHIIPYERAHAGANEANLYDAELALWKCIRKGDPPEATERDWRTRDDEDWHNAARDYIEHKRKLDDLAELLEVDKNMLRKLSGGRRSRGSGVKVNCFWRKGNVDYARVPELVGVDLDDYRKKPSFIVQVSAEGEEGGA